MAKQIIYGDLARRAVLRGVNQPADAVKVKAGPRAQCHRQASTLTIAGMA
jgi:chaperonin GroEL (HSP60 family)